MATFIITLSAPKGTRFDSIAKELQRLTAEKGYNFSLKKEVIPQSRPERLAECDKQVQDAKDEIEQLRDELQEWRDNLPESLSSSQKADDLDEAISELDTIHGALDEIDMSNVSFPSMM